MKPYTVPLLDVCLLSEPDVIATSYIEDLSQPYGKDLPGWTILP